MSESKGVTNVNGIHEYKYLLDGAKWRHDPGNRLQAGYYHNSVLELGKAR